MNYRFLFKTKNVDEEIYYSGKGGRTGVMMVMMMMMMVRVMSGWEV